MKRIEKGLEAERKAGYRYDINNRKYSEHNLLLVVSSRAGY
jgi:hypothetical protein